MLKPGNNARLVRLPPWAKDLGADSRQVFEFCVGRSYPITEIDQNGLVVLDVSSEVDARFGGSHNDIRLEQEFLEEVPDI